MSVDVALGAIVASTALVIALMLLARRFAPRGGHFADTNRATGVYGIVGAGFAILLGFVVLLAFQRYWEAKSKASEEATAVFQQYQVAALFRPERKRNRLWGELACYARAVVEDEWPAMESGRRSRLVDLWVERMEAEVPAAEITTRSEETAYQQWFENAGKRDAARRERLLEADGSLPALLWIVLILAAVSVVAFTLLFADREERLLGQAISAGSVAAVVVSSLLAVVLLASPFGGGHGRVAPSSMRYTLETIEAEAVLLHDPQAAPCDARGRPRRV